MSIFDQELGAATVLSIGHRPGLEHFHTRVLQLVRTPAGATLNHKSHKPVNIHRWLGDSEPPARYAGAGSMAL
jgi:putative ATP-binding cassette transporter